MRPGASAGLALAAAIALLPRGSPAMTADGAMITNFAAATGYWGIAGPYYTARYTVSYNATAGVLVSCPVIYVTKTVTPTTLAVAQTATYTVCTVNTSLNASAFNVVISDALPDGMQYVGSSLDYGWNPPGGVWTVQYSADGVVWAKSPSEPPAGQTAPAYMRWRIDTLGPNRSTCVTFKAVVW